MIRLDHRFVFWIGVGLLTVALIYVFVGASPPQPLSLAALTGSDGRCTGFPNGIGQWNWSTCCAVHDAEGVAGAASDGRLATCLLENTPVAATPLVFLACAVMAGCRPIYNALQRWGWVR
jgi:hypothetical protein